ncbi:MAG TPA: hypothetical protein VMS77_05480 [Conexivisphaerales archaeon]|nr:hypothetical protein [Conexivisphaerales archaeon]
MVDELVLGTTILGRSGRTTIPKEVMELLDLRYAPQKREKLLWTQKGDEVVVTKGTPASSYQKTILSRGGRAAVPRHIRKALKLDSILYGEEGIIWIRKGDEVIVRKGSPPSRPTE